MQVEDVKQQRNRFIGGVIRQARLLQGRSVTECSTLLGTSRRRFTAMERGEVSISYVDLELLMDLLQIPMSTITASSRTLSPLASHFIIEEYPEQVVIRLAKQHEEP